MKRFPQKPSQVSRKKCKSFGRRPMFGTSLYDGTYCNELSGQALMKNNFDGDSDEVKISPAYDPKSSFEDFHAGEDVGESAE